MSSNLRISAPLSVSKLDPTDPNPTLRAPKQDLITDYDRLRHHRLSGFFDRKQPTASAEAPAPGPSILRAPKAAAIKVAQADNRRFSMPVMPPKFDATVDTQSTQPSSPIAIHPVLKNVWFSGDRAEPKQHRLLGVGPRLFTQADQDHVTVMHKDLEFLQHENSKTHAESHRLKETLEIAEFKLEALERKVGRYRLRVQEAEAGLTKRNAELTDLDEKLAQMTADFKGIERAAQEAQARLAQAFGRSFVGQRSTLAPVPAEQKPTSDLAGKDLGLGVASSSTSTSSKA